MSDSNDYLHHLKRDSDVDAAADDALFVALLALGVAIVFALVQLAGVAHVCPAVQKRPQRVASCRETRLAFCCSCGCVALFCCCACCCKFEMVHNVSRWLVCRGSRVARICGAFNGAPTDDADRDSFGGFGIYIGGSNHSTASVGVVLRLVGPVDRLCARCARQPMRCSGPRIECAALVAM
jgi:hypothetical protein